MDYSLTLSPDHQLCEGRTWLASACSGIFSGCTRVLLEKQASEESLSVGCRLTACRGLSINGHG